MAKVTTVRVELLNVPKPDGQLYDKLHRLMASHGYTHKPPPTGEYISRTETLPPATVKKNVETWVSTIHSGGSKAVVTQGEVAG